LEIIAHRINSSKELTYIPSDLGVEIDIRTDNNQLILSHDPFQKGELFEEWLDHFQHKTLILNLKEEGLEIRVLELMHKFDISNFFFLDQSFPFLVKTFKKGIKNCAVRISEYESLDTAINLKGKVEWVWIDFFTKFPLNFDEVNILKKLNYKLCLVSPELQGYDLDKIIQLKEMLKNESIWVDAVCTKEYKLWKS
tara:strand:- start:1144 stop:1731 length:588 start_codon:yes stop_codon:yes gene_type:complete